MRQKSFSVRFLICFFIAVTSFLCLLSSGNLDSEDGWLYASVARTIYYHHQVAAAPDEYPDLNVHMNTQKGADGVWRAPGSLGYSLSLVPAVAISDLIHRAYGVNPPDHFPLEHDWSFHLFASFTNAFYGGVLAIILLLYAHELGFSRKVSIGISLLTLGTTSLLPLTKFSFAQLMFISGLMASFYFIKRFGVTQKIGYLIGAGVTFGLMALSYNQTFMLTVLPLGVYLLMNETPQQRRLTLGLGIIGALGAVSVLTILKSSFLQLVVQTIKIHPKVLFEGVWGFLLSPGKSIFLYSPPLLLLPIFWHKIKKTLQPELIAASLLTFCYLYVVGSAALTKGDIFQPIWHGGMGWGARYISPLIPLWMLIVFQIIQTLKVWQKKMIVLPLFLMGAWIQLVGVSTSYLLQYIDLPYNFYIGKSEITVYDYASFIPRYTPLYTLSKEFVKIALNFPNTVDRSKYAVRFFDGFDVPNQLAVGTIRGFRDTGAILFSDSSTDKPQTLTFNIYNAPDVVANQQPAEISVSLNDQELKLFSLAPQQDETIQISLTDIPLQPTNRLIFKVRYAKPLVTPQVIYLKKMLINQTAINLKSLDYPDLSNLGVATTRIPYEYTGKVVTDKWVFWQLRARVNERTLDFWWLRNLYFWDRPSQLIWGFVLVNLILLVISGRFALKWWLKEN